MASHTDIANRWASVHAGTESCFLGILGMTSNSNIFVSNERIYSYGSHFEIARFVQPKTGAPFFLLNGDTYSVTTSRHQREVRSAVERHADKFASLIVPYSALASAGIDLDSLSPVDIEKERNETTAHTVNMPGLVKLAEDAGSGTFGWNRLGSEADVERGTYTLSQWRTLAVDGVDYSVAAYKRGYDHGVDAWTDYDPPKISYYRNGGKLTLIEGDTFRYDTYRHFLGAAVFRGTVTEYTYRPCRAHADNGHGYCDSCGFSIAGSGMGRYSDSPPMVETKRTRRAYFLSAFDSNESHPHYFLAELPARWDDPARTRVVPTSVVDAFRYLVPAKVRDTDRDVKRQGDIFAIPADDIAARYPIAFRHAEKNGSIPIDGTGRHIATELVTLTSVNGKDVRYFSRGKIVHDSGRRSWSGRLTGREHKTLSLGTTWHELVRNLVPMAPANVGTVRTGRRPQTVPSVRSWSIIGRVD